MLGYSQIVSPRLMHTASNATKIKETERYIAHAHVIITRSILQHFKTKVTLILRASIAMCLYRVSNSFLHVDKIHWFRRDWFIPVLNFVKLISMSGKIERRVYVKVTSKHTRINLKTLCWLNWMRIDFTWRDTT